MTSRDCQFLSAPSDGSPSDGGSGDRKQQLLAARRLYYRQNRDYELTRCRAYRAGKVLGLPTEEVLALWGEKPLRRSGKKAAQG